VYGGAEVVWRDRLKGELADALAAQTPADRAFAPTFGGSAARTGVATGTPDVAAKIWETPWSRVFRLPGQPFASPPDRRPVPCHFPVIDGGNVFACDDSSIHGWKLATGEPIWEGEQDRPPHEIFHLSLDDQGHLLDRNDGAIGVPHHTVTVHRGRLYARLGAVDRVHHATGLPPGRLVCLDVGEREGQPVWVVSPDDITAEEGNWMFEGTPAVTDAGVFVAMSRPGPRPACGLAALHPETGRVRWFRVTCDGMPRWRSDDDRVRGDDGRRHVMAELSHSLVTVAEGRVFHTTHMGAVVALDERTGRWEWGATYPQAAVPDVIGFSTRRFHGPSPALCAGGILVVAPHDSSHVLALDSETGLVRWSRPHGQRIATLLGIADGRVYASGDEIVALDAATGNRVWGHGTRDDQLEGNGRGVLSGDEILWPLRDAIRVIDRKTGRFVRQPIDLAERGVIGGGHLAVGPGVLLVSSPFGIAALGERGAIRPEKPLETRAAPDTVSPQSDSQPAVARLSRDGVAPVARTVAATQGSPSRWWRVAWEREFDRDCRWTVVEQNVETTGKAGEGDPSALLCDTARGVTALEPRSGNELWRRSLPGRVARVAFDEGRLRVDTSLVRARLDSSSGAVLDIGGWSALGTASESAGESLLMNDARTGLITSGLEPLGGRADRRSIPSKIWSSGPRGVLRELSTPRALEWRRNDGDWVGRILLGPDDEITQATLLDNDLVGIVTRQHRCALWRAGDRSQDWYEGAMSRAHALPAWIGAPPEQPPSGVKLADPYLVKDGLTLVRVDRRTVRDRWAVDLGPGIVERVAECVRRVQGLVVVLGRHDLRGIDAESGSVRWSQPLEGGDRDWRWEGVSITADTLTLRRGFPEGVEFLRVDAVDGLPVQRIVLPYRDDALVWHEWPDRACVTGPRMAMGWVAR
jgi:outer membrane protein assembly factor BamB